VGEKITASRGGESGDTKPIGKGGVAAEGKGKEKEKNISQAEKNAHHQKGSPDTKNPPPWSMETVKVGGEAPLFLLGKQMLNALQKTMEQRKFSQKKPGANKYSRVVLRRFGKKKIKPAQIYKGLMGGGKRSTPQIGHREMKKKGIFHAEGVGHQGPPEKRPVS